MTLRENLQKLKQILEAMENDDIRKHSPQEDWLKKTLD